MAYKGHEKFCVILSDIWIHFDYTDIGNLELKLLEYKKYCVDDLKLIESLQVDKKWLQSVVLLKHKLQINFKSR